MSETQEFMDGLALWDEHKPQSGEDWVAVAERFIAAGDSTKHSSPLFAALVLAVKRAEAADIALEEADDLLRRLAEWDQMEVAAASHGDGVFWRKAIAKTRAEISVALSTPEEAT